MSKSCEEETHGGHNRSGSHVTGRYKTLLRFGIRILRSTGPDLVIRGSTYVHRADLSRQTAVEPRARPPNGKSRLRIVTGNDVAEFPRTTVRRRVKILSPPAHLRPLTVLNVGESRTPTSEFSMCSDLFTIRNACNVTLFLTR